jgi:hypothetical protein
VGAEGDGGGGVLAKRVELVLQTLTTRSPALAGAGAWAKKFAGRQTQDGAGSK